MNADLIPAAVAVGGGSALLGGIYYHEHRRAEAMRASRRHHAIRFPVGMKENDAQGVLGALSGLPASSELILEVAADENGINYAVILPEGDLDAAKAAFGSAAGNFRLSNSAPLTGQATLGLGLYVPRLTSLRSSEIEAGSRALLAGLAALGHGERVVIRWALRPGAAPELTAPAEPTREWQSRNRVWVQKAALPGFFAGALVLVTAPTLPRARVLTEMVAGIYRSRRGALGQLMTTIDRRGRSLAALPRVGRSSGWLSAPELLGLLAWPIGETVPAGVELGASRELRVRRDVGREGRRLFIGRDGRGERWVALSPEAARHHLLITGPSGTGKSALLARGILDDIAAGHAGCVLDPKNDLVEAVLERVPAEHADRVVVLDPAADGPAPGLALLSAGDPELRSDVIVGALKSIFAASWGIRSEVYLHLAIRTLSEVPGARLTDIGRLFFDGAYRRAALGTVRDPLMVAAWRQYESLSPAEQIQHIQSPMTKVMALLSRPAVRAVLASQEPKLDIAALFARRQFLLVPLSPGRLGEPASQLLGAAVMYCVWAAIEGRAALRPDQRDFVSIVIDELATVAALPFGFELLAERARGWGAGLSVGLQSLGRLPDGLRGALLANTASIISFRAGADDAARLARELPGISAQDLQHLGRFGVAARVGTGLGSAVSVMTGRTEPLPPTTGQAARIRRLSAERYGSPPETDAMPAMKTPAEADPSSLGRARREA